MLTKKFLIRGLGIFSLACLLITITATPALAFDNRSGDNVVIGKGEIINNDLYLLATKVTVDGTVNGDVFAFGQDISINGTINGGLTVAGQTIYVNGKITRGLRAAGMTVSVGGSIERDVVAAGNTVSIESSASIGGDLVIGAQTTTINGSVAGNIKAQTNKITLTNSVGGFTEIIGSEVTITSSANIKGNLTYTSKNAVEIQAGAKIGGAISHNQPKPARRTDNLLIAGILGTIIGKILAFVMLFIIGLILILLFPKKINDFAHSLRVKPVLSLGWGALLFFITPIAAFVVMCTIIGFPLGFITLALWGMAVYLSQVPVAFIIGRLIFRNGRKLESKEMMVGVFALGLLILSIVMAIPVLGWIICLATAVFGMGTLISSWKRAPITTI